MEQNKLQIEHLKSLPDKSIDQDILRFVGLPQLLGHEKDTLNYFLGRNLGRKIDYQSIDDVIYIFQLMNWGHLELVKENRKKITLYLMSDEIVQKLKSPIDIDFKIEAGFIAEAIQLLHGKPTECLESVNKRLYRIEFTAFFTN